VYAQVYYYGDGKLGESAFSVAALNSNSLYGYKKRKAGISDSDWENRLQLEMWANAQRDGRPAEHTWRLLFNAAKFD